MMYHTKFASLQSGRRLHVHGRVLGLRSLSFKYHQPPPHAMSTYAPTSFVLQKHTRMRMSCSCSVRRADPWFQSQQDVGRNQSRESRAATSVASKTTGRWRQGAAKQEHLTACELAKLTKRLSVPADCSVTVGSCTSLQLIDITHRTYHHFKLNHSACRTLLFV